MSRERKNKCLEEFITIYRSEPCLWKVKSPEYHDRIKKDAAYFMLVEKLKEIDPGCTKSTVLKKINNLRSGYLKELKKVKESIKSGASGDEVYKPKLWYYKLLDFLEEILRKYQCSPHADDENSENEEELANINAKDDSYKHDIELDFSKKQLPNQKILLTSGIPSKYHTRRKGALKNLTGKDKNELTKELLLRVKDHFKQPYLREDRFDIFGMNVAMKLRDLDCQQRRLVEKLINEVLFEAECGNLTRSYALIN